MKLTIEAAALSEALQWTVKAIAAKPPNPLLSGVLLTAKDGVLGLAAFNFEVSHRTSLTADIDADGTVLVAGSRLSALVKSLRKGQAVTLEVQGNHMLVQSGRTLFTLGRMPVDDYPAFPDLPPVAGTVDGAEFSRAIEQTAIAANGADVPILGSLQMIATNGRLAIMSTDRYRLAMKEIDWDGDDATFLARATDLGGVAGAAGQVTVHADENLIGFTVGPRTTTVSQQGGDYPKIQSLFANTHNVEVVLNTAETVEAVQRAALVAERNTPIRCEFTADGMFMDAGTGEEAQSNEYVACQLDGDPITAAFNPAYLLDALRSTDGPTARIQFVTATKPALIMGGEATDYRHLVMPVRLPGATK